MSAKGTPDVGVVDILQNILVQNVNTAFVYITDWTST